MTAALYDQIGKTYDQTRRADPEITQKVILHLNPHKEGKYLDIGCGSGNYTQAISQKGFNICGLDISQEMLGKARQKCPLLQWIHGDARKLPFLNGQFDGAICILATHHIKDIVCAFREIHRVLRSGHLVIFTAFPEQIESYWLKQYFPKMMRFAAKFPHYQHEILSALSEAGFKNIQTEKYFVTNDVQDWFLNAGKYRPHLYLDPAVRAGISPFVLENNKEEVQIGCESLRRDIESGEIHTIINAHESDLGDYAFIKAEKLTQP